MSLSDLKIAIATDLASVEPISGAKLFLGKDFIPRQETDADGDYTARVVLVPTSFTLKHTPKTVSYYSAHTWKRAVYARIQVIEVHCWAKSTADLSGDDKVEANLCEVSDLVDRVAVAMRRFGTDESTQPGSGAINTSIKTNEYGAVAVFSMSVLWPVFDKVFETIQGVPGVSGSYT